MEVVEWGVPMYDCSRQDAVFVIDDRSVDLFIYQRVNEF